MTKKLLKLAFLCSIVFLSDYTLTAQATQNQVRKRYPVGPELRHTEDTRCYEITKAEADRAFELKYWEDAGKLYRAAKLCSDATQSNRALLNSKIEACSKAAEAELQAEREKAVKLARQSIASNRANDAKELLAKYDRTTAYRLAKFANDYIAPPGEDNPDCVTAINSAWRQKNPAPTGNKQVMMPLSYELMYTNDDSVAVRFQKQNNNYKLFAFSPKKHTLYEWSVPEFKLIGTTVIDSTMREFDISPDGRTMVFRSHLSFLLIRNRKEHYIRNQERTNLYCFSPDGRQFFYIDRRQKTGVQLNLDELFNASKEKRSQKGLGNYLPTQNFRVDPLHYPAALHFGYDHIWMIYPKEIIFHQTVAQKGGYTGWAPALKLPLVFPDTLTADDNDFQYFIDPADNTLYRHMLTPGLSGGFSTCKIKYQNDEFTCTPDEFYPGELMSRDKIWHESAGGLRDQIQIKRDDGLIRSIQFDESLEVLSTQSGSAMWTGENSGWLALSDLSGTLRLWQISSDFTENSKPVFTTSGALSCASKGLSMANCVPGLAVEYANSSRQIEKLGVLPNNLETPLIAVECSGSGWVACSYSYDTVALMRHEKTWLLPSGYLDHIFRFDDSGNYFVMVTEIDSVTVYQLDGNEPRPIAGKRFDAPVSAICPIPNSTSVVVQRMMPEGGTSISISLPKIWDFGDASGTVTPVRLEEYMTGIIKSDKSGKYLFFSDGRSVKVFKRDDLKEEIQSFGTRKSVFILDVAVHPDNPVMALAYSDGLIGFYNYLTGQNLFHFTGVQYNNNDLYQVRMTFTPDGLQLITILNKTQLLSFEMDINEIRKKNSISGGQLTSFAPEQIGHWGLDKAMMYDNNFDKLARSGDIPLIRSFFTFYSNEAKLSTRLDDVENFCNRATYLYDRLDEESKKVQYLTLLSMYDNYMWKLLQRNRVDEVDKILRAINTPNRFKGEPVMLRTQAHIALLRNDLRAAARSYAAWIEAVYTPNLIFSGVHRPNTGWDNEQGQIEQLIEYGYISGNQQKLVCTMLSNIIYFSENICPENDGFSEDELQRIFNDQSIWLQYKINQLLQFNDSEYRMPFASRKKTLTEALQLSLQLQKFRKQEGVALAEETAIKLAATLKDEGKFEILGPPSPRAIKILTEGIGLLENKHFTEGRNEIYRLDTLAALYLSRGQAQFVSQPDRAVSDFYQSAKILHQLDSLCIARLGKPSFNYQYQYFYAEWMIAQYLMKKERLQEARQILENIQPPYYALPVFETGLAYLEMLSGDRAGAFINLGSVKTDYSLAEVLANISMYADQRKANPEQQKQLLDFGNELFGAILESHPEIDSVAVLLWKEHLRAIQATLSGNFEAVWEISSKALQQYSFVAEDTSKNETNFYQKRQPYTNLVGHLTNAVLYLKNVSQSQLTQVYDLGYKTLMANQKIYLDANLLYLNCGHIQLILGNTDQAILLYETFDTRGGSYENSYFDHLLRDFRSLHTAGIRLPDLPTVIKKIFPEDYPFTAEELRIFE